MRALTNPRALSSIAKVGLVSGPLGVLLDNQHGLFGTLNYSSFAYTFSIGETLLVKSAYWVPVLFTFAGVAMSAIQLAADARFPSERSRVQPSWPTTLNNIGFFAALYYISGALDSVQYDPLIINLILSAIAVAGFSVFDGTVAGLILALATAIAGPIAEIGLINVTKLYSYSHADILGICQWIPAVYFLGGSAVGNLARSWAYGVEDSKDRDTTEK